MSKKIELEALSLDELWSLHEKICAILSSRIKAEKYELEKRLAILSRGIEGVDQATVSSASSDKPRRKYPRVLPKYRDPKTYETWSGRGKRPRWLVAAMKSGHKIEEFRISEAGPKRRQTA
ncbi:H-NS family nucleoid-associated regulatory protein [Bradyrhizobium sp.]|uniref:H-NS histone family protein n=1 Tax=Bradyrhizobium sp. TaxID=376 RepID=UPI0039E6C3CD